MARESEITFSGKSGMKYLGNFSRKGAKDAKEERIWLCVLCAFAPLRLCAFARKLFFFFVRRVNDDLHSTRRRQTTNHLCAIDLRHLVARRVPELDPERTRRSVDRESGSVDHYRNRLGDRSRPQRFKQLRNVRLELLKLDQHRFIVNLSRRQLDGFVRFE